MSETVCDLANASFQQGNYKVQPHRLSADMAAMDDTCRDDRPRAQPKEDAVANEALAKEAGVEPVPAMKEEPSAPPSNKPLARPIGHTDVFMDDFIQLGQGSPRRLNALRDHLLPRINNVLAQPLTEEQRNEAVSITKMLRGDGSWASRKELLGWILDFTRQTLELPPHRKLALATLFRSLKGKKRVSEKTWQRALGKLRFVAQAIPGATGLFCSLQLALNRASDGRVRISPRVRHHLDTFEELAVSLSERPTHLAEIVEQEPSYAGATDAAKAGMGGAYILRLDWRAPRVAIPVPARGPEAPGVL